MRVSLVLLALALVGLAAGCSKSPTTEYDAVNAVVEQARVDGAEQYAPALFKEVTDSLNTAAVEMQKQDDGFSLFRSYGKAGEIIAKAQQLAEKAKVGAATEKERTRVADSVTITEIEALIVTTRDVIANAPRGKGSRVDLKVMESDVDAASGALTAAMATFQSGNYLVAKDQLQAVKDQVTSVKTAIEAAKAKVTTK